jgi:hypothetical protein
MLTWYEESTWALLIGEKKYGWEETPVTDYDASQAKREGAFKLSEDGLWKEPCGSNIPGIRP